MNKKTVQTPGAETTFIGNGLGYQRAKNGGVAMFTIDGLSDADELRIDSYKRLYQPYIGENVCLSVGGYHVPVWGEHHNLYPQEVDALIRENKLLPGILRKQEDFLYGHGPYLYQEQIADGKKIRVPVEDDEIQAWLDSWEQYGVDSYRDYLRQLIADYYRVRTCISQYHFATGRRMKSYQRGSVLALAYIGADEARLATELNFTRKRIKQSDCHYVAVGDWMLSGSTDFEIYNRFDPANPYAHPAAIAFNSCKTFGKWVYAYNEWFAGLREWVKASNLTPRYLNSYLKNALNAHVHVKIPNAWVVFHKQALQQLCQQNLTVTEESKYVHEYRGVKLVDPESKKPYRFSEVMVDDLIALELEKITKLLSGEGKNQGKLYATTKMGQEGWEFVDFPSKFKDYFDSVIKYDERADKVTLAGIGISSSITNVENDGVISKSGSDVYYNYIVYLNALTYAEQFVCKEINRAIQLNFPRAVEQKIRLGFNIEIPVRQQDTTPSERMEKKQPVG